MTREQTKLSESIPLAAGRAWAQLHQIYMVNSRKGTPNNLDALHEVHLSHIRGEQEVVPIDREVIPSVSYSIIGDLVGDQSVGFPHEVITSKDFLICTPVTSRSARRYAC